MAILDFRFLDSVGSMVSGAQAKFAFENPFQILHVNGGHRQKSIDLQ